MNELFSLRALLSDTNVIDIALKYYDENYIDRGTLSTTR